MPFDPTKPEDDSLATAVELRNQLNGLADLIGQKATLNQVNQAIAANSAGSVDNVSQPTLTVSDPPTQVEMQQVIGFLNEMFAALKRQ